MICLSNFMFQSGFDLNVERQTCDFLRVSAQNHHAPRQARICATHVLAATEHVSRLCGRPSRRTQGQRLLVSGSILCDGFCPVDLSRVAARHRGQLACPGSSAVPHRVSLPDDFAQHAGQCERHTPVANLRRFRPAPDWLGTSPVCHGAVRAGTRRRGLRLRCQHHRPLPVGVCLGTVSLDQGDHQVARAAGLERKYSHFHSHYRRQDP
jgi:hypothetical protein